jgi:hypothetical protein
VLPVLAGFRSGERDRRHAGSGAGVPVRVPWRPRGRARPVCPSIHHAPCVMCAPCARGGAELYCDGEHGCAGAWGHGSVRAKGEEGEGEGDTVVGAPGGPWPHGTSGALRCDGDSTLRAPDRMGARGAASQKQSTKRRRRRRRRGSGLSPSPVSRQARGSYMDGIRDVRASSAAQL